MSRPIKRRVVALLIVAALLLAGAAGGAVSQFVQANAAREEADEAEATIEQVCTEVAELGGECTDQQLEGVPGPPGEKGDPGPAPTEEQILAAVTVYMSTHDVVEPGDLIDAVAAYLTEHPPAPGADAPPVTAEQLLAAVAQYLAVNPPPAGPKGDPGPGPTQEELMAALALYIAEHPGPYCPSTHPLTTLRQLDLATGTVYEVMACARPADSD